MGQNSKREREAGMVIPRDGFFPRTLCSRIFFYLPQISFSTYIIEGLDFTILADETALLIVVTTHAKIFLNEFMTH